MKCICTEIINGNPDAVVNPDCPLHGSLSRNKPKGKSYYMQGDLRVHSLDGTVVAKAESYMDSEKFADEV